MAGRGGGGVVGGSGGWLPCAPSEKCPKADGMPFVIYDKIVNEPKTYQRTYIRFQDDNWRFFSK